MRNCLVSLLLHSHSLDCASAAYVCYFAAQGVLIQGIRFADGSLGFTLLSLAQVVYGTAVAPANSSFSPLAPLAAGLAIFVAGEASAGYTGSPLNRARLIGPAIVFLCNWRHFWEGRWVRLPHRSKFQPR